MRAKVAIVGAGFMGETHANSYRKINGATLAHVCDIDPSKGKPLARSTGATYVSDFSELLAEKPDIVDICLPTALHRSFAVRALEEGFNVFLEKPLAIDLEDGEAIVKAAFGSAGLSMVGHVLRFWPGYAELHERAKAGEIGKARHLLAYRVGPPPRWAGWYMDMKKSNGVIFDLGIHDIDYVRWVMGEPHTVFSQAYLRDGVHVHGQVLLGHSDWEALCECSWMGSPTFPFTTYIEIAGTGGLVHLDGRAVNAYAIFGRDGAAKSDPFDEDGYVRELRHFVECVKDGREPDVPVSEGLRTMRVALAAVESAKLGEAVVLG